MPLGSVSLFQTAGISESCGFSFLGYAARQRREVSHITGWISPVLQAGGGVKDHWILYQVCSNVCFVKEKKLWGGSSRVLGRSPGKASIQGHVKHSCWSLGWLQLKSPYLLPFRNIATADVLRLDFVSSLHRILKWASSLISIPLTYCVTQHLSTSINLCEVGV